MRSATSRARTASRRAVDRGLAALLEARAARQRPAARVGAEPATLADVVAGYRLILGRLPDPTGLNAYRHRIAAGAVTVEGLAQELLGSGEFARAHRGRIGGGAPASELVETSEGFRLYVDATDYVVGSTISLARSYEPEVSNTLRAVLGPGETFVDVGANVGWFTMLAAGLVGPEGRVVAVEPNPRNVALARMSAKDNGFDNVEVYPVALSERPGAVALDTDGSNGRIVPVDGPPSEPFEANFVVAARPLDEILEAAGVDKVHVLKVDVEGAEPLVLAGAQRCLSRDRPVLISEFSPLALDAAPWGGAQRYLDTLRGHGYRLRMIGADGDHTDAEILAAVSPEVDHVDLLAEPL
jgi:FkbM family methyltransferase